MGKNNIEKELVKEARDYVADLADGLVYLESSSSDITSIAYELLYHATHPEETEVDTITASERIDEDKESSKNIIKSMKKDISRLIKTLDVLHRNI